MRLCFEILGAVFNGSASQPYRMPQSLPRDMYVLKKTNAFFNLLWKQCVFLVEKAQSSWILTFHCTRVQFSSSTLFGGIYLIKMTWLAFPFNLQHKQGILTSIEIRMQVRRSRWLMQSQMTFKKDEKIRKSDDEKLWKSLGIPSTEYFQVWVDCLKLRAPMDFLPNQWFGTSLKIHLSNRSSLARLA